MSSFKESKAPTEAITVDKLAVEAGTGNIYESIMIIAKRSKQINTEIKNELLQKLNDFASIHENLEEVFENREQIEVSKYYEKLPKPTQIALHEWLNEEIYFRSLSQENT